MKSKKIKEKKQIVQFYEGKPLKGLENEIVLGERIRKEVLQSTILTEKQKKELMKLGGFTYEASWWIKNKKASIIAFRPSYIVKKYRQLLKLKDKYFELTHKEKSISAEIINFHKISLIKIPDNF